MAKASAYGGKLAAESSATRADRNYKGKIIFNDVALQHVRVNAVLPFRPNHRIA